MLPSEELDNKLASLEDISNTVTYKLCTRSHVVNIAPTRKP